jgi:hypothetical protein
MELALPGLVFFDPRGSAALEEGASARAKEAVRREKRLFCARCRHPITHQDERIRVNGGHEHTCVNPAGYTYTIGCFREAGGCSAVGEPTHAHTWFPGYAWRIALCARCEQHLGWRFQSDRDRFHGLILDRLTSNAGGRG